MVYTDSIQVAAVVPTGSLVILVELQDFVDIFKIPENPVLVKKVEYKIETSTNLPFRPIYNLSSCKLAVLQEYLDTAFKKR